MRGRHGVAYGIAAYGMWGLFPLYWPLLKPSGPVEILAHRMVWSLVCMLALLAATSGWRRVRAVAAEPGRVRLLAVAAVLISANWVVYIWGVNSGHVVETSLGYFVNPLVTVLLGVFVLHERLRPLQWAAVGLGLLAVLALTVEYGRPPWIALVLACSFGGYGFVKKRADVGAVESLTIETGLLFVPALGYLVALQLRGQGAVGHGSTGHLLLLAASGVVTAVPLLCFGAAAIRVPLTTMGLLQYLTPTIQFLIGVLDFHEAMPPGRLAGFALVWLALCLLSADALRTARGRAAGRSAVAPAHLLQEDVRRA